MLNEIQLAENIQESLYGSSQPRLTLASAPSGFEFCEIVWKGDSTRLELKRRQALARGVLALVVLLRHPGREVPYELLEGLLWRDVETKQQPQNEREQSIAYREKVQPISRGVFSCKISIDEGCRSLDRILTEIKGEYIIKFRKHAAENVQKSINLLIFNIGGDKTIAKALDKQIVRDKNYACFIEPQISKSWDIQVT
ncbi:hypothetical protein [Rhodovastum atsumiense]|uniref:Uncharacterized protein n=1 Tax=Rhodovastum atsumiense TaxID=504468 RepID=A0A5M6IMM0_9PROT|nr:hypothetical protein [Rhodovastum atsumiense]KAA5609099.1 hypothetical protein F1189_25670 [Rhodovastum atsumiense]